jgi:hypothetical protein
LYVTTCPGLYEEFDTHAPLKVVMVMLVAPAGWEIDATRNVTHKNTEPRRAARENDTVILRFP